MQRSGAKAQGNEKQKTQAPEADGVPFLGSLELQLLLGVRPVFRVFSEVGRQP